MDKLCGKRGRTLPLSEFHRFGTGRQPWCKACKREYAAAHYVRNRARRVAYHRQQRQEAAAWYLALKAGRSCTDCGGIFHPAAMQWDHPPDVEKVADVARLYGGSPARVLAEIAKCELVCANCHAIRTYERRRQAA